MPSAAYSDSMYASISSSTTVTKEATMTMKAGSRTSSGITLRSREITTLEMASTTRELRPMPRPLMAEVVTARVGHMPSIRMKAGFSLRIPL